MRLREQTVDRVLGLENRELKPKPDFRYSLPLGCIGAGGVGHSIPTEAARKEDRYRQTITSAAVSPSRVLKPRTLTGGPAS